MSLALVLLILALLLGGVGLFVTALKWLIIVGIVLFLLSVLGFLGRGPRV